jgi:hypothetical protein
MAIAWGKHEILCLCRCINVISADSGDQPAQNPPKQSLGRNQLMPARYHHAAAQNEIKKFRNPISSWPLRPSLRRRRPMLPAAAGGGFCAWRRRRRLPAATWPLTFWEIRSPIVLIHAPEAGATGKQLFFFSYVLSLPPSVLRHP